MKFQPEQKLMEELLENDICNEVPHDSDEIGVCTSPLDSF